MGGVRLLTVVLPLESTDSGSSLTGLKDPIFSSPLSRSFICCISFRFKNYLVMCVSVCGFLLVSPPWRAEEGVGACGARVKGGFKWPNVSAGN